MLSAKWWPFCPEGEELMSQHKRPVTPAHQHSCPALSHWPTNMLRWNYFARTNTRLFISHEYAWHLRRSKSIIPKKVSKLTETFFENFEVWIWVIWVLYHKLFDLSETSHIYGRYRHRLWVYDLQSNRKHEETLWKDILNLINFVITPIMLCTGSTEINSMVHDSHTDIIPALDTRVRRSTIKKPHHNHSDLISVSQMLMSSKPKEILMHCILVLFEK